MNFIIKNKFSEIFFLIKKKKSRDIKRKDEKNQHKKAGSQKQAHKLRNPIKYRVLFFHELQSR